MMEFHQIGQCQSAVNAIEIQYGNPENNVDYNGVTYDTRSPFCHERTPFQLELEKTQPPNKRSRNSNSIGFEELKELPTIWEDIASANKEEQVGSLDPSEIFDEEANSTILQSQLDEDRVSEAICLLPGSESKSKGSYFKTRLCNKWEQTGCPFGNRCHFAHGYAELRGYDGELLETEAQNSSMFDVKQKTLPSQAYVCNADRAAEIPSRRLPNAGQKNGEIPTRRWKGPDKISKIYGDWIDDL